MELYHNNVSVCAQRVRIVLAEKGLTPIEHHFSLRDRSHRTPEYLKLNPGGYVPTLIDRGRPVLESTAICEYLDDAYPDPPLRPVDPIDRAVMRKWTAMTDSGLLTSCSIVSFGLAWQNQYIGGLEGFVAVRPESMRERWRLLLTQGFTGAPWAVEHLVRYDALLSHLASRLKSSPWLAGDTYSLADIGLLPYIVRLNDLTLAWLWEENQDRAAAISDWYLRCKTQSGYSGISGYPYNDWFDHVAALAGKIREDVETVLARART